MPVDTEASLPKGLPMAMTHSPTVSLSESPISMGVRSLALAPFRRMTARSLDSSEPTSSAS